MIANSKVFRRALRSLRPTASWTLQGPHFIVERGEDGLTYPNFTWLSEDQTIPTEQEIQTEIDRLESEWTIKSYQRSRAAEYPSIGDQLDALFHAGMFPSEMAAKIQAVKTKYPKSE